MSDILRIIFVMSLSGSIVAVFLFTLKPFMRNRLPKSAQYYLWLVVIVALLVPVSRFFTMETPLISETVKNYAISTNEQIDANQHLWLSELTNPQGERLNQSGSIYASTGFFGEPFVYERKNPEGDVVFKTSVIATVFTVFKFIYPIGVLIVLLYYIISYAVFIVLHRRHNHVANADEFAMLAILYKSRRIPHLYRNPLAATPMLIGVFYPAIILPDREYTNEQFRAVLLHELTHLRRKDILVKWMSVLVTAVHWFNPIVWFVRREIDRACELACDEAVIRNLDTDGKQNYGETLLYVAVDAKTPHAVFSTTMCEEKKALKERLGAIMKSRKHTRLAILLSAVLIVVAGVTTITLGAGTKEAIHNFNVIIINDIGIDIKATEGATIEFYENGIERITIFRAYGEKENESIVKEAFDIKNIDGIEEFLGKGTKVTFNYNQDFKYVRYVGVNGITVTFAYIEGIDGGIENRIVRAVITPPTSENSSPPISWWSRLFTSKTATEAVSQEIPGKTPLLDVSLIISDMPQQIVKAAQLTNSWYVVNKNGDGSGYSADSFHPLQKPDGYSDVTLKLNNSGTITFFFSDNYPPQFVSVQRWSAEYAGTDSVDVWDNGEFVNVTENTFQIADDGNDYIYEVYAKWNEGDSWYVFRINSGNTALAQFSYLPQIMHDGIIYYLSSIKVDVKIELAENAPKITSVVSLSQLPNENGQANFGKIGDPYTKYNNGLLVRRNNSWEYFVTLGQLPDESALHTNSATTGVITLDYSEIQQNVNNGSEIWRLNPEEVASRYADQVLNFQGKTSLYRNDGSEYARVIFTKQNGGEIHIDLYQPAKKGDGGIWAVECWFDENSRMYQVRNLMPFPPMFHNDENVPVYVRDAVRNVVVNEWTETFGRYYQVLGFYADNVNYTETGSSAELKFIMTIVTQNFYKDPDTVGYIMEAKEKGSSYYQQIYDEYNMPKSGSIDMKVTMSLTASGGVEPGSIQIYSNISPHGEEYVPTKADDFIISD